MKTKNTSAQSPAGANELTGSTDDETVQVGARDKQRDVHVK